MVHPSAFSNGLNALNIRPSRQRTLFGSPKARYQADEEEGSAYGSGPATPPPLSMAPPPPENWREILNQALPDVGLLNSNAAQAANEGLSMPAENVQEEPAPLRAARGVFGSADGRPSKAGMPSLQPQPSLTSPTAADTNALDRHAQPLQKPKFFGDGGTGRAIAGHIGDALMQMSGGQPIYGPMVAKERLAQSDQLRKLQEMAEQARLRRMQPDYYTVGRRRIAYTPETGQTQELYTAPLDAEDYAAALGAEPGTPNYNTLVQDYILRHSGPTATDNSMAEEDNRQVNRRELEDHRQEYREELEGIRHANRRDLKGVPTFRDRNPRPAGGRSTSSGKGSGSPTEQTATNPVTGQKAVLRNGKWVIVQ